MKAAMIGMKVAVALKVCVAGTLAVRALVWV
jgi:hypothetical protein